MYIIIYSTLYNYCVVDLATGVLQQSDKTEWGKLYFIRKTPGTSVHWVSFCFIMCIIIIVHVYVKYINIKLLNNYRLLMVIY